MNFKIICALLAPGGVAFFTNYVLPSDKFGKHTIELYTSRPNVAEEPKKAMFSIKKSYFERKKPQ